MTKFLGKHLTKIIDEKRRVKGRASALKLAEGQKSAKRQFQVSIYRHGIEHKCLQCFFPYRSGLRPLDFLKANISLMDPTVPRPTFRMFARRSKRLLGVVYVSEYCGQAAAMKGLISV